MNAEARALWSRLYDHLMVLMKFKVLTPSRAAVIFAPLLISADSPYESKVWITAADVKKYWFWLMK